MMNVRKITIKIGTAEHRLVESDTLGCNSKCSLEHLCMRMGYSEKRLCDALIWLHDGMKFEHGRFELLKP